MENTAVFIAAKIAAFSSHQGVNFAEIRSAFNSSLRIRWHVPYKRPNLPAISEMVLRRLLLMIILRFCMFPLVDPVRDELNTRILTVFPTVGWRKPLTRLFFFQWHRDRKLPWANIVSEAGFPSLKQSDANSLFLQISH